MIMRLYRISLLLEEEAETPHPAHGNYMGPETKGLLNLECITKRKRLKSRTEAGRE